MLQHKRYERDSMSHVLSYRGQYFRVDVAEVANSDAPDKSVYASWCSDAFRELKDLPQQTCSRFTGGSPLPTRAEALRHAYDWIRRNWDAKQARPISEPGDKLSVVCTAWLFKGDDPTGFDFKEFSEAKAFAEAAQKSINVTKVGVKNNESPQFLTLWEKS